MSDQPEKTYEILCLECDARRPIGTHFCGKCHDETGAYILVPSGATVAPSRLKKLADQHKASAAHVWSNHLQRYVYRSEWTGEDMRSPDKGTPLRFPGSDGTLPTYPDPKPRDGEQREMDLSSRYDLKD